MNNRPNPLLTITIALALFFVGWQINGWRVHTDLEQYREQVEHYQDQVDIVNRYANDLIEFNTTMLDSLSEAREASREIQVRLDNLSRTNTMLDRAVDSLHSQLQNIDMTTIPTPVVEYITALEVQVDTLKAENTELTSLLSVKNTDIRLINVLYTNEKARADSLQITINTFPTNVPDNEHVLGFIPLPSRTTSFVAGAVVATVTTVLLRR